MKIIVSGGIHHGKENVKIFHINVDRDTLYSNINKRVDEMIENGLDCARLNFSHGSYDEHFKRIERVKKLRKKLKVKSEVYV